MICGGLSPAVAGHPESSRRAPGCWNLWSVGLAGADAGVGAVDRLAGAGAGVGAVVRLAGSPGAKPLPKAAGRREAGQVG